VDTSPARAAGQLAFGDGGRAYLCGVAGPLFTAYDAATVNQLWQTELYAEGNLSPVTYSVRGLQYVAVVAGGSGPLSSGSGLTPEIISPAASTTLWVFKLPSR
jgi:quinohemoprotein ethanol dehydrogenase